MNDATQNAKPGIIGRVFRGIWRPFDILRRILHLLLLLIIFLFIFAGFSGSGVKSLTQPVALVFNPNGQLVEELSGDATERAYAEATGSAIPETTVKELVDLLKAAKDDANIPLMVLNLNNLAGGGVSKMQVLADAIKDFKASGKKVYIYANFLSQNQYYLASLADEVHLHPQGAVLIEGFGRYRMFYKDALDKLLIDWNVFKVGEYKSFVEPYLRNDMSEEDKNSSAVWMGGMWDAYTNDIEAARGLEKGAITNYSNNFADTLEQNGGSMADAALSAGLVDKLSQLSEFRQIIIEQVGKQKKENTFNQVSSKNYASLNKVSTKKATLSKDKVAVVIAAGSILDGTQPSGSIGGDSTSKLIRKATNDKSVKALVLKVDSGGGSAFASDVILTALEEFKATDRPIITSMGSVAASGGYMISLAADEIWATPTTITGSIGIFGMLPTFDRSLNKLGLNIDGTGTTKLSGALTAGRALDPEVARIFQANIEHGYDDFIGKVALGRDMTKEAVDKIARGRVWFAKDALEIGLVDKLGSFDEAIEAAAGLAGLDDYQIKYIKPELSFTEQLVVNFSAKASVITRNIDTRPEWQKGIAGNVLNTINKQFENLNRFNDPVGVYADCLCADNL